MKSSLEEVIPIALSYRIIKNTEPLEEKKLTSLDLSQYMEKSEALKQDEIRKIIKREDPMDVVKREIRKNLEEEIEIKKDQPKTEINIKPDDYAMILKAFMLSDIKDWETRKEQLNKILSDNLEVIVMLKNDLGAEYFNKEEFTQMLVIPSENLKKMKIIQLENDENNKIKFVRIRF